MVKTKALLIGINYKNTCAPLAGCTNDVHNMSRFLESKGFNDIIICTDENPNDTSCVSGRSILQHLSKFALDTWSEDIDLAWFHFSGHGCQIKDANGDEADHMDECICPIDYEYNGVITDDTIRSYLNNINPKTRLICVFDCCHSGTIADLPYVYKSRTRYRTANITGYKSKILMISGCEDEDTSADAFNVFGKLDFTGALTSCLLETMKSKDNIFDILDGTRVLLQQKNFTQYPQLSSSYVLKNTPLLENI